MSHDFVLFAGRANPALATAIARDLGVEPGACTIEQFPDGEIGVQLGASVRGKTVFLLQPTSPPVNDHLVELLVLADACRRAAAALIIALVPYFGYARSDKRQGRRTSITARAVAECLETLGITHVVTVDVHAAQMEGFFHIPIDNLTAVPLLCAALQHRIPADAVVVAPDLGAVRLATDYSARLGVPTVICHKQRVSGTQVKVARLVGDVRERSGCHRRLGRYERRGDDAWHRLRTWNESCRRCYRHGACAKQCGCSLPTPDADRSDRRRYEGPRHHDRESHGSHPGRAGLPRGGAHAREECWGNPGGR